MDFLRTKKRFSKKKRGTPEITVIYSDFLLCLHSYIRLSPLCLEHVFFSSWGQTRFIYSTRKSGKKMENSTKQIFLLVIFKLM